MMKKGTLAVTLIVMMLANGLGKASAQDKASAHEDENKTWYAYRLDFSVSELEDGKKINTRQYAMNSKSGDANEIKIGTRVPVESNRQGEFQYLDVGTNIWCRLRDQADVANLAGSVLLNVKADITNFAMPEQQGQRVQPVIRQLRIESSTIGMPGKPLLVGTVDDPNSKRQFQLEVTVTKLK